MDVRYIGVPEYDSDDDVFFSLLEFQHRLFRIILQNDLVCPALLDFPTVPDGYRLEKVNVTAEMDEVLRASAMIASGSDATIRVSDSEPDCVIKCALPFPQSRARVAYEYRMLIEIEQLPIPLPVVRTRGTALLDSHGVFAFRLEKLQEWDSTADLSRAMRDVTRALHRRGLCHNDLRQPNLMRDGQFPTLIDFDRAGFIGSTVPSYINLSSKRFSVNEDITAMRHFGGLTIIEEAVSKVYGLVWSLRWFLLSSWLSSTTSDKPWS